MLVALIVPITGDVYFMLRGKNYTDGDTVMITDIGEGDNALLCVTDNTKCCRTGSDGEFFYPDGTAVGFSSTNPIYRNRGEQVVRLNRRNGATSPLGRYRCAIPDASGVTRSITITIGETQHAASMSRLAYPTRCLANIYSFSCYTPVDLCYSCQQPRVNMHFSALVCLCMS